MTMTWQKLARYRVLVVTGKGGVGKSAVAAALGQGLAKTVRKGRRDRRVLVIEVDPRENVHQMFGVAPSGGAVVPVADNLWVQNLKPRDALDALVRKQVGLDLISKRVLSSNSYNQMAEGTPGLKEVAVLSYVEELDFDTVILDAPATGHGVSLLAAPRLLWEVIEDGPVGNKARDLAGFVADRRRLGIVIVTLAEEMPVAESLELKAMVGERLERSPELLVINGLYPSLPRSQRDSALEEADGAAGGVAGAAAAIDAWYRRRRINERELKRLEEQWSGERVELPLLPLERGPELALSLTKRLCLQLGPTAGGGA